MSEVIEQTDVKVIEAHIENALVKENLTEKVLSEMEKEYLPLKIKDFEDKEGYELVRSSRLKVKAIRVLAVKCTKKGRESAQAEVKAWVAKEKEIVARIEKVETYLEQQEGAYEAEKERVKAEKKRQQDAALIERSNLLLSMGAAFTGLSYDLENVSYELETIKCADTEVWEGVMFPKYKAIFDRNEAARIAEENKKKEEQERLEKEQAELKRQQEALQQQQAELKRQQEEVETAKREAAERARKELIAARSATLEKVGVIYSMAGSLYSEGKVLKITTDEIATLPEAEWLSFVAEAERVLEAAKEKKERIGQRKAKLAEMGMKPTPNGGYQFGDAFLPASAIENSDNALWGQQLSDTESSIEAFQIKQRKEQEAHEASIRQKAIDDEKERLRLEEVKRQEELAQSTDADRWKAFLKDLSALQFPQCKSTRYKKIATMAYEKIEEIKTLKA